MRQKRARLNFGFEHFPIHFESLGWYKLKIFPSNAIKPMMRKLRLVFFLCIFRYFHSILCIFSCNIRLSNAIILHNIVWSKWYFPKLSMQNYFSNLHLFHNVIFTYIFNIKFKKSIKKHEDLDTKNFEWIAVVIRF